MHAASVLSLAFAAALLGCAAESPNPLPDETASARADESSLPARDLTLRSPATPSLEVASPVELARPRVEPQPARRRVRTPRPALAPSPAPVPASPVKDPAVLVPALSPALVLADPAPVEDVAVGAGRELAPGKTVTVIPASAGPSSAAPDTEEGWAPSQPARGVMVGGGGGRCRPRGGVRGIGIAGRIPLGIPGRRLR
ncbi:MAG: hypothetical protein H0T50_03355 [Gemmatimonadales bacterium]|nr:hypothetical protein [Gemmatimonadales bacterium]